MFSCLSLRSENDAREREGGKRESARATAMATSVGASLVQQAGVVALLNPKNTAGVARAACILIGAAYPVYRTFKALERRRFLFDNSR